MSQVQKTAGFFSKEPAIYSPIFLLCSLLLVGQAPYHFDFLFTAAAGFFLSARLYFRGFFYALLLLGVVGISKHTFFVTDHLWFLGIEASFVLAFFIAAISFKEKAKSIESIKKQIESAKASSLNLEEELKKLYEEGERQGIAYQEKLEGVQKEFEELQSEHASILILNEVLRKKSAKEQKEAEEAFLKMKALDVKKERAEALSKESQEALERFQNSDGMAILNKELMEELSQELFEKEKSCSINETLQRQCLKERLKVKEADVEIDSLKEQLRALHKIIQDAPLKKALEEALTREEIAKEHVAELALELQELEGKAKSHEALLYAEAKMAELAKLAPLYKQLKKQFEEKNEVLEATRRELFKTDTELKRQLIEKQELEMHSISKEIEKELEKTSFAITRLEEENRQLLDLVTKLSLQKKK